MNTNYNKDFEPMTFLFYNRDLANRFVSDLKLPIQNTDRDYFFQQLRMLDDEYDALTEYNYLCEFISKHYDGDPSKFLKEYYDKRDEIINDVLNYDGYKAFNEMDMNEFAVDRNIYNNVTSNNVYNMSNIGKTFLSIDLTKANFQTLRYVNALPYNCNSYTDFIGKYTALDYIKNSKYTRQVIFGKLNPKRTITVEKWLLSKLYLQLVESQEYKENEFDKYLKLVSASNDELVFEVLYVDDLILDVLYNTIRTILSENEYGIQFKLEMFNLEGLTLQSVKTNFNREIMYKKIDLYRGTEKLMCVPSHYFPLVYSLDKGWPIEEFMYHFTFEGLDCRIMEHFRLVRFKNVNGTVLEVL